MTSGIISKGSTIARSVMNDESLILLARRAMAFSNHCNELFSVLLYSWMECTPRTLLSSCSSIILFSLPLAR